MEKQLNVWINEELKEALTEQAQKEKKTLKELIEETLQRETTRYHGERIEQQALPLIRDIIQNVVHTEVYRIVAQLEAEIHDYLDVAFTSQREYLQCHTKSQASLLVRTVRDGEINRGMLYTQLAKAYGSAFAQETHEKAVQKASQEITARVPIRKPLPEEKSIV